MLDPFGVENYKKLNFKYPPEQKASNIGEKIIGLHNIAIHWKYANLQFILYVRKYKHVIPRSNDDVRHADRINLGDEKYPQDI